MTTLRQYLSAPAAAVEKNRFSADAAACFAPLLSRKWKPGFLKWFALRKVRAALIDGGFLKDFSLHLLWKRKAMAYMDDAGKVYLSAGLLLKSSAVSLLSVFSHELAHIRLSQEADYPALKDLQRTFKSQFREHKLCELLSPIEYYAMDLSCALLTDIAEYEENPAVKARLLPVIADLEEKIRLLEQELAQLAQNYVT